MFNHELRLVDDFVKLNAITLPLGNIKEGLGRKIQGAFKDMPKVFIFMCVCIYMRSTYIGIADIYIGRYLHHTYNIKYVYIRQT
jgi:hypothetical protein